MKLLESLMIDYELQGAEKKGLWRWEQLGPILLCVEPYRDKGLGDE